MESKITATELARTLGDVLGRIRYRGDSFVVERNGEPVARIAPLPSAAASSLIEGFGAWKSGASDVGDFAADLDEVNRTDRPPTDPWDS